MSLRLGDIAPDFDAQTTLGPIRFHDWTAGQWCVLFSHPGDFTPVCTTEMGAISRLKGEFDRRGDDGNVMLDTRVTPKEVQPGTALWYEVLPPHSLENVGTTEIHVLTVELK